ncbi:CUE domain-containing protein 2 [Frankliniella occidentalis]|uniref:CUE domain-containing protein 2 n=1 Tax=Frankliniella occidentalis TaxID=133901 RepID=A0A6J1TAH9_FRAOC|nr:CUE domain-containing protein 2 [Frankliniella occidentalis]XP_052121240.1 CUE domain-containing protein 2 [Frankliniella occidentalis]
MSLQTIADQTDLIKESLLSFIQTKLPEAQLIVDDIVLNYFVSILEELGESQEHSDFDIDGFCEMMSGFVENFSTIPQVEVATWMFELEARLRDLRNHVNSDERKAEFLSALLAPIVLESSKQTTRTPHTSESSLPGNEDPPAKRVYLLSETSDGASDGSSSGDSLSAYDEAVYVLQEMFPTASLPEIQHCVSVGEGDAGRAAQLVIDRMETGLSILPSTAVLQKGVMRDKPVNDDELKSRIIAKYSYVDREDDHREHHPIQPKSEPKKLVRYRDNKIVSLKGERFTEVKKEDMEEPKKPVASVKPPRKSNNH